MTSLPVSGLQLMVRQPASLDELAVLETDKAPPLAILDLASRVVAQSDGTSVGWDSLPASEVGAVALAIRRAWIGDALLTDGWCPEPECGQRIDVSFRLGEYLEHFAPSVPSTVEVAGDSWYKLAGEEVRFRVPTVADLVGALHAVDSAAALSAACVLPAELNDEQWPKVDAALEELSPNLDGVVGGRCPECGSLMQLRFEPCGYVITELRDLFAGLYFEVHLLARTYGWSEADILAMGRSRRIKYAHLIAEEMAAR
jgi:hypothetical protein